MSAINTQSSAVDCHILIYDAEITYCIAQMRHAPAWHETYWINRRAQAEHVLRALSGLKKAAESPLAG